MVINTTHLNHESIRIHCVKKQDVEECFPFDETVLVFKTGGKIFALLPLDSNPPQVNLKCDPDLALELRERYDFVQPGFHMNKKHWNTVICDGRASSKDVKSWIDHSYELIHASLPSAKKKVKK